jgi:Dolichyl-phosphate-mannose-protein mannosyltransferase
LLGRRYANNRTGLCAAAPVATSAILFFFSRMALLEEPLMMLTLAAILLASRTRPRSYGKAILLGVLLGLMMLTKTTAVCLFPAALYALIPQCQYKRRPVIALCLVSCLVAGVIYAADRYLLVRPHMAEFHDLWIRYDTAPPSAKVLIHSFLRFFYRGFWAGPVLFPLAVIAILSSAIWMRRLFLTPLFAISVLWLSGVGAFLIYHFYGPPRYFSLLTVPICFIAVLWCKELLGQRRSFGIAVLSLIVAGTCWNVFYILRWDSKPEYQYAQVSGQIRDIINSEPNHSHYVIGHGAAQLRLFTDLDGVDAAFGPATLDQKMATYHPGWFVSWNGYDSGDPRDLPEMARHYRIVPRGSFLVFHDRVRNRLTLYELDPR